MHEHDIDTAIIGGTGFYELLTDSTRVLVDTPYGAPSEALTLGSCGGRRVVFLPRHGAQHRFPAHRINYRANLWALRQMGVRRIVAPTAVGSLRRDWGPGVIAAPDQIVDRTTSRAQSFYDLGAAHVPFADPYCPSAVPTIHAAAAGTGTPVEVGGTLVTIEGPRFSTRAESRMYAAAGCSLINMTAMPEAVLARELGMCYTTIALVTDLDAGVDAGEAVRQADVFESFTQNVKRLRVLVDDIVARLPADTDCSCRRAREDVDSALAVPGP